MKRLLLLLALLVVSTATFSAVKADKNKQTEQTEQTDENEEEKSLSTEERAALIHKTLREREVELVIDPWGGSGVKCKELVKTSKGYESHTNKPERFFERGYTFKPIRFDGGYRYTFEEEGKYYAVNMSEANKETYVGSREGLIDDGYSPCGRCNP